MTEYLLSASPVDTAVGLVRSGIFDTYMVYERAGTWTVAGGSLATVSLDDRFVSLDHGGVTRRWRWRSHPLVGIGEALAELPIANWTAYGWLAFEIAYALTGRADLIGSDKLAQLIIPQAEIRIGPDGTTVTSEDGRLCELIDAMLNTAAPEPAAQPTAVDIGLGREWYLQAVADAVEEIHHGALQRVVLSRSIPVGRDIDIMQSYLQGRTANTPARSFLMDIGGREAAGFCPEMLLEAGPDRQVSTQPLAGTRAYQNDTLLDEKLRNELLSNPKEIHEHAVSVKLAYDELNSVCSRNTVKVDDLMSIQVRGSVQHLSSTVSGQLAAHNSAWHALEAVFPATTSSGAPKKLACEYISKMEPDRRGLYSGGVLTASHDGSLEVGLVLRTLFGQDGQYWVRAGAGIVDSSQPEREYQETCEKLGSISEYLVERSWPRYETAQMRDR